MQNLGLVLLLLTTYPAHAASFDCAKAKTHQEKAICASPELSAADDKMAEAYRAVLAAAPAEMKADVRSDQRAWIRGITFFCKAPKPVDTSDLTACLLRLYDGHTWQLERMVLKKAGVTFVWRSITVFTTNPPKSSSEDQESNGSVSASWPQANSDSPEWKAWDSGMEAAAHDTASWVVKGGEATATDGKQQWIIQLGTDAYVTVSVEHVYEQLVEVTINNIWDAHGAHPMGGSSQFNWMLNEKRELRPEDFFKPDSGWDMAILRRCKKEAPEQNNEEMSSSDKTKTLDSIVRNPRSWQMDEKGLTLPIMPDGDCNVCKSPLMTIPWNDLKPYLKPGFVIPK